MQIDARIRPNTSAELWRIASVEVADGAHVVGNALSWRDEASHEERSEFLGEECTPETIAARWGKESEHFRLFFFRVVEGRRVPMGHSGTLRIVEDGGEVVCERLRPPSKPGAAPLPEGVNSSAFASASTVAASVASVVAPPVEPPRMVLPAAPPAPPALPLGTDPMAMFVWMSEVANRERAYAQAEIDRRERAIRAEAQLMIERERAAAEREASRMSDHYREMGKLLSIRADTRSEHLEREAAQLREEVDELREEIEQADKAKPLIPGAESEVARAINGVVDAIKPFGPVVLELVQEKIKNAAAAPVAKAPPALTLARPGGA